jgi:hypothetical protein
MKEDFSNILRHKTPLNSVHKCSVDRVQKLLISNPSRIDEEVSPKATAKGASVISFSVTVLLPISCSQFLAKGVSWCQTDGTWEAREGRERKCVLV